MQLSETIKLYPTREQKTFLVGMMNEYTDVINRHVSLHLSGASIMKMTTKDVDSDLPSNSENCAIQFTKAVVKKYEKELAKAKRIAEKRGTPVKEPTVPIFKRPFCGVCNQDFEIVGDCIKIPIRENGKVHRILIKSSITERQKNLFEGVHLGELRLVPKGRKIVAQIPYDVEEAEPVEGDAVMGVDLGIKCPAVAYVSDGSVLFCGNGRQIRFIRRRFIALRRDLQKAKRLKAVKRMNDREQRIMRDIDHKISRMLINFAKDRRVAVIKLENLTNVRRRAKEGRRPRDNYRLSCWSFYRLAQFISYKAKLAGIKVVFVDPAYTSQECPNCGAIHKASDRTYICKCGYRTHRDIVGAINICNSTKVVGAEKGRRSAQRATSPALGQGAASPSLALRPSGNALDSSDKEQTARISCARS